MIPNARTDPTVKCTQLGVDDQRIRITSKRMMERVTAVSSKAAIINIVVRAKQSSSQTA